MSIRQKNNLTVPALFQHFEDFIGQPGSEEVHQISGPRFITPMLQPDHFGRLTTYLPIEHPIIIV